MWWQWWKAAQACSRGLFPLGRSERRDSHALEGQPSREGADHQTIYPGWRQAQDTSCPVVVVVEAVSSLGWEVPVSSLVECDEQGGHCAITQFRLFCAAEPYCHHCWVLHHMCNDYES